MSDLDGAPDQPAPPAKGERKFNCRRCATEMVAGYIPDTSRKTVYQTQWYRGVPEVRIWHGKAYGIVDTKDGLPIIAYRCPACGAMMLNAPPAGEVKEVVRGIFG